MDGNNHAVERMGGCSKISKILLFVSNLIVWVGSIVIFAVGILVLVNVSVVRSIAVGGSFIAGAYILIIIGAIIFFISLLGCCGAIKEVKCMLLTYFVIVLILFVILLVGGICGAVYYNSAESRLRLEMQKTMKDYVDGGNDTISIEWDLTQTILDCCGIDNYTDWTTYGKLATLKKVPKSCCKTNSQNQTIDCTSLPNSNNAYLDGCLWMTVGTIKANAKYIGGAGIGVALLMLLCLVFAMIVYKSIQ